MVLKTAAIILAVSASASAVAAQTPEPKMDPERAPRVMAFSTDGAGGFLGVQTKEVSAENYASLGLDRVRGVAVESVVPDSPAEKAQLQKGDVIVRFNGEEVTSARKLTRLVGEVAPDHQATLTVVRGGAERDVSVTIAKRPVPAFGEGGFSLGYGAPGAIEVPMPEFRGVLPRVERGEAVPFRVGPQRRIGVSITPLTKQLAEHFSVTGGVMVSEVRESSPASKAGLRAGDIITEVDGKAVANELEVISAISAKKEGDVTLSIVRKGERREVRVTPEEAANEYQRLIGPEGPGTFRMTRPTAPVPLNQLMIPGRVL